MFRHGTLPSAKLRIPHRLMQWPTWIEPNIFGDIIHYSPLIEMLLHVATHYVNHPMGAYSQLLRRTLPEFDMFEDYRNTCVCPQCKDYGHSDDEDEEEHQDENRPTWDFLSDPEESEEESSQADSSSGASLESLPIIQQCASSSQTPPSLPSPRTRLYELLMDEDPMYDLTGDYDEEMYDGTSETPEAEGETTTAKIPLTPDSLQNECHSSTVSDMIQATFPSHL